MKLAIKDLKLNSSTHIAMFDRINNSINIYPKTKSGRPNKKTTKGWDVLQEIADDNFTSVSVICEDYHPDVFANRVSFQWRGPTI